MSAVAPFVGRDKELAAVAEVLASGPALIVIEGEAGVGKSRLVTELAQRHPMLIGGAPPFRQPYTLAPVVDALRGAGGPAGLGLSPLAGALRPLFPEWAADLPPALEVEEDHLAARHRLFRAMTEMLGAVDAVALSIEDAHWADDTTLEFLLYLAALRPLPMSLLVTCRPDGAGSLLAKLMSHPPAGGSLFQLTLEPLDVVETGRLMSVLLGGVAVSDDFAKFVHDRTDGLPLAVEESLRLMRDRADLVGGGGEWRRRSLRDIHVPSAVRDAILERVARLGPECQMVLKAAAVIAGPVDAATLLATAGLPADSTAHLAAVDTGLLDQQLVARYGFAHALPAQVVYDTIPGDERRALHARAAENLASSGAASSAVLARHFRDAGDVDQWLNHGERAVADALELGDEATAGTVLHDLLAHARLSPEAVAELACRVPLSTLSVEQFADLTQVLRRALVDAALLPPSQRGRLWLCLAKVHASAGSLDTIRRELEAALPALGPGTRDEVEAMLLLAWPHVKDQPRDVLNGWMRRAEAAIPALPPADQYDQWRILATELLEIGDERGWTVAARIESAPSARHSDFILRELNLGESAIYWGRFGNAHKHLATALETATEFGYLRLSESVRTGLLLLDWYEGRWDGLVERAASIINSDAAEDSRVISRMTATIVARATGELASAEQDLQHLLADRDRQGDEIMVIEAAAALAHLYLDEERVDEALEVTEGPTDVIRRRQVWFWGRELLPARVAGLVAAGRAEDASSLVGEFGDAASDLPAPSVTASVLLCRALSCTDDTRAAGLFAEAAEAYSAMPRPYDALLARAGLADRMSRIPSSRAQAARLAEEIVRGLDDLGAIVDADRLRRFFDLEGVPVTKGRRAGRPGYGDELSPRELEVVRLVVAGHTNREIADILHRSPNTVASQLAAAMRKLSVSSRTALAVAALDQGVAGE